MLMTGVVEEKGSLLAPRSLKSSCREERMESLQATDGAPP